MNAFEEILQDIGKKNPEDQAALQALAERNPELRDSVLRQSDYSRQMDEHKKDLAELSGWRDWRNRNWDDTANATKAEAALRAQLVERMSELEQSRQDGTMSAAEGVELKDIKERFGLVSQAEVEAKFSQFRQEIENFGKQQIGAVGQYASGLVSVAGQHMKEFGEALSPDALIQFANEKKIESLPQAYNEFVRERRETASAAARQKEIDEAKEAGRRQAEREFAERRGSSMPVDSDGQPAVGHLQKRYLEQHNAESTEPSKTAPLGAGILARQAALAARQRYPNSTE